MDWQRRKPELFSQDSHDRVSQGKVSLKHKRNFLIEIGMMKLDIVYSFSREHLKSQAVHLNQNFVNGSSNRDI